MGTLLLGSPIRKELPYKFTQSRWTSIPAIFSDVTGMSTQTREENKLHQPMWPVVSFWAVSLNCYSSSGLSPFSVSLVIEIRKLVPAKIFWHNFRCLFVVGQQTSFSNIFCQWITQLQVLQVRHRTNTITTVKKKKTLNQWVSLKSTFTQNPNIRTNNLSKDIRRRSKKVDLYCKFCWHQATPHLLIIPCLW